MNLAQTKTRLTILDLWARYSLPGTPSKSCKCPWREDHKPSFSVSADGLLWHDFAAGKGGDAIDFLAELCQLDRKTACRTFLEMANGMSFITAKFTVSKPSAPVARAKPVFPEMETGTPSELEALAKLRGIGREGLEWASERGVLRFTTSQRYGVRAWVVTNSEGVNAQARRLDGQCWEHLGGAKAWTLPGSWASWPLGITEAKDFLAVALCEGGPDFLAAHYLALFEQASHYSKRDAHCAPVAMPGASQRIHAEALPHFARKHVRIFCHADEAGHRAARQWAEQLATVDAIVDAFDFTILRKADGGPVKDLNDFVELGPDEYLKHPEF